jgi:bromodomain-containing factor 1
MIMVSFLEFSCTVWIMELIFYIQITERDQKIAELERHIATISQQIASIKSLKKKKPAAAPVRRQSKPAAAAAKEKKVPAPVKEKRKRVTKKKEQPSQAVHKPTSSAVGLRDELPEFTFDQKKDLSERINNLSGDRLNTVVSIIQSSMPNLDGVSWCLLGIRVKEFFILNSYFLFGI